MFGLDDWIAGLSDGGSIAVVVAVAVLLGLRHATDPDHIAAVTTLVASGRERATGAAARLGAWWGAGHALTLVVFGIPILLADRYLPDALQRGAETAVAALIVFLAVRLIVRWQHGAFACGRRTTASHRHPVRSPAGAFGIGLVHGMGGSAGVGVLLLAAIPSLPTWRSRARRPRALHRGLDDDRHDRVRRAALGTRPSPARTGRCRAAARRREPRVRPVVRRRCVERGAVSVLTRAQSLEPDAGVGTSAHRDGVGTIGHP